MSQKETEALGDSRNIFQEVKQEMRENGTLLILILRQLKDGDEKLKIVYIR